MVSIYELKPKFQSLLRPIVRGLAEKGITPNQITCLAAILSFVGGGFVLLYPEKNWPLLTIPIVLFLRMALNAIDGMLAREHDMKTPLGAVLNELGDVLSDAALYLPLAFISGISAPLIALVVILAIVSEMTGVVAIQIGAMRRYDGPMGKSDRAFVFGTIGFILGIGFPAAPWVNYLLIIMLVLVVVTIVNRARRALEETA